MAITAALTITATVSGSPEGGSDAISVSASNTSGVNTIQNVALTTANATATGVALPTSAAFVMVLPTTGAGPFRITGSTAEVGLLCSTVFPSLLSVTSAGSTMHFYTTGGTTFNVRVIVL